MVPEAKKSEIHLNGCTYASSDPASVSLMNKACKTKIESILDEIKTNNIADFKDLSAVKFLFTKFLYIESLRDLPRDLKVFFEYLLEKSTPNPEQFAAGNGNGRTLFECYVNGVLAILPSPATATVRQNVAPVLAAEISNVLTQIGKHAVASTAKPSLFYESLKTK